MAERDKNRRHSVAVTLRLTPEDYEDLIARCEACEPPTNPTQAMRWLVKMWVEEGHTDKEKPTQPRGKHERASLDKDDARR